MKLRYWCAFLILGISQTLWSQSLDATRPAQEVLERLMPAIASQFTLVERQPGLQGDGFRITGTTGHIRVEGATLPTILAGVNWYLKYVAHLQVSTNGSQLGPKGLKLPAPSGPIEKPALYPWRYALNQNVDGYTAPYWDDKRWQHEIDILALSGSNAILIERGTDYVLYKTFLEAGYSDEAIRGWISQPAHQNWQLMGNLCCYESPISLSLLQKRAESAQKIIRSLRRLGITPVLPGYFGIVPEDFSHYVPSAHVVAQGSWNGATRPGWLDPRDPNFIKLARSFYRHQSELYGATRIYDMEIFQEGGRAGDVPVTAGAKLIQAALQDSHPGALWMIMGWQNNPTPELLAGLDPRHTLIVDIRQGRVPDEHRDHELRGIPWLFGGIWEFGGRTTMGAPLYDYAVRFPTMAQAAGSHIEGIALFTEALDTNPFAFDLYMEMAWHKKPVDLASWADAFATRRYGAADPHALKAWRILLKTAYGLRADAKAKYGEGGAAPDSLFNALPSLMATSAYAGGIPAIQYDPAMMKQALTELLEVAPNLRGTTTYRYDIVDVARQVMANESRRLLPQIKDAFEAHDNIAFDRLTAQWLGDMQLQDSLLKTNEFFLVGRWLAFVPQWASSPLEEQTLNFDARSILTTWSDEKQGERSLHDYGNKDWAGLTRDYYMVRWEKYFDSLRAAMVTRTKPQAIDWFALGDQWNHGTQMYSAEPVGDSYLAAIAVANRLHISPARVR